MRILYFAPRECWPPNTGASLRNYHLARALAQDSRVTYLAFADRAILPNGVREDAKSNGNGVARWCEEAIILSQPRAYTPMKLARGAFGTMPVTVLNYTSRRMAAELERVLSDDDFDLVQVESVHLESYLPVIRRAHNRPLIVCDWHNIESDLMRQYGQRATNPLRRAYAARTATLIQALERRMARVADANTLVSESDRARVLGIAPNARTFVIENGVDVDYFSDEKIGQAFSAWSENNHQEARFSDESRNRVLFVGSMDYHANIDAAIHLARSIWPLVIKQLPEASLTIVGRNPTPEIRALASLQNVEVTGTIEDIRPYYRGALASVAPINVAGGSRLKICEAMAAGVPVVSTRLGAEGIDATNGENIILAETPDEFCQALQQIAGSDRRWQSISVAGRRLVSEKYDWSILGTRLAEIFRSLVAERSAKLNQRARST